MEYKTKKEFRETELKALFESVHWLSANYSERLVKAIANSDTVISAWDGERLVGLVNALDDGELTAYVHYLLVHPAYQKSGVGTELMTRIKKKYEGYLALVLTAEAQEVVAFYETLGFRAMNGATPMLLQTL